MLYYAIRQAIVIRFLPRRFSAGGVCGKGLGNWARRALPCYFSACGPRAATNYLPGSYDESPPWLSAFQAGVRRWPWSRDGVLLYSCLVITPPCGLLRSNGCASSTAAGRTAFLTLCVIFRSRRGGHALSGPLVVAVVDYASGSRTETIQAVRWSKVHAACLNATTRFSQDCRRGCRE